ncbi:MAG TPA: M28 family peptidase [Chitinophagales bacterium]|nr:M28 family peptidase [Chitinophagales bacterium]
MKDFVKQLAIPRPVGSAGHETARRLIHERLAQLKTLHPDAPLKPYAGNDFDLPYTRGGRTFHNVIARLQTGSSRKPVLLGAHYDTCGHQPGADDNAAAVAISFHVLERLLENQNWKKLGADIVFAFFDAEEPPNFLNRTMGSICFYEEQRTDDFALAVVMDLVGHDVPVPGLENLVAVMGMESHPSLERLINSVDTGSEIGLVAVQNHYIGDLSDHHIFRVNGVPFLFFSCGHWLHYHRVTDTWEKLNYDKMKAIADYLYPLILTYSTYDPETKTNYDPTQTELKLMNTRLKPLLAKYGIGEMKSRADMEKVIQMLLSFGL